ncbi:putative myosin heavy chain [Trypanosoma grayi]|uniref:putative myosin heavy chain n=1 Tax=Trypanosoma grayi TaxID=71804 RepID=UPI0004F4A832|nr:putative myosin heavy chain [Trypanosoma grayi]KEG06829.1 putative myosin heavy chain [Trypanosoma grayi]
MLNESEDLIDSKNGQLHVLNKRIEGLVGELNSKRDELSQVIAQLDDFVAKFEKAREGEKAAVEKLAARDEEFCELQLARDDERAEHERAVSLMQEQLEHLRDQQLENVSAFEKYQGDLADLREALQAADAALADKNKEIDIVREQLIAQREEIVSQREEAQAIVDELASERDRKCEEVSDSLKKLEEFVEMLQEARESEEEAVQRREEAERSLYDTQKELEKLRSVQAREVPHEESEVGALRAALDEAYDMHEEAEVEIKNLKEAVRLLMDALSHNQAAFNSASGVIEDACGTLTKLE